MGCYWHLEMLQHSTVHRLVPYLSYQLQMQVVAIVTFVIALSETLIAETLHGLYICCRYVCALYIKRVSFLKKNVFLSQAVTV
jgi:hypothetical protein